jgi:hypothetical protein
MQTSVDRYRKTLAWPQVKVFNAIVRCRTAALGGHLDQCDYCQHRTISYNSCRNRHCPKCYGWADRPQKAMKMSEAEHWREVVRSVWHWSFQSVEVFAPERTNEQISVHLWL